MTIQGKSLGQILTERLEAEGRPATISEMAKQVLDKEQVSVSGVPYKVDMVNSPEHYKAGGIETIDYIEAKATEEELRGYLKYNVIKYLSRAKYKGNDLQDLKKAQWYLNRLVSKYGEPNEN